MALGGNLTLHGDYRVATTRRRSRSPSPETPSPPACWSAVHRLGRQRADWQAAGAQQRVRQGRQRDRHRHPQHRLATELVPTGGGASSAQHVILTTEEPTASVVAPGLIDFGAAFTAYNERSQAMADCPNNVTLPTDANGTTAQRAVRKPDHRLI